MIPITDCDSALELAEDYLAHGDRPQARDLLVAIVAKNDIEADAVEEIRAKEQAIYRLSEIYKINREGSLMIQLLTEVRPFLSLMPKAKTTKMVRSLFESIVACGVSLEEQHQVCLDTIHWARTEKRTFLRHRLQLRLVEVLFDQKDTRGALSVLNGLLREVRRLDDRTLLLDIHLLECRIYYSTRNNSKARAALVAARTTANSIYCPPLAQAEIDLLSGVLHAEEHDPKTAYSYLYEAFEGYHQLGDQARQARRALRYMILAKIATDNPDELAAVLASKNVLEYTGPDIDALRGIAQAYNKQDTHLFNDILEKQKELSDEGLVQDEVIGRQLEDMYDTLIERHLLRIIEPYNRVQVSYLASLLRLNEESVEGKISQLILDKKLDGIVDQQHNCLVVFDDVEAGKSGAAVEEAAKQKAFYENAADQAAAETTAQTTLHQDALVALENFDALVTVLFDKVSGKFDGLVEEHLAKRKPKPSASGSSGAGAAASSSSKANDEASTGGKKPPSSSSTDGAAGKGGGASGAKKKDGDTGKGNQRGAGGGGGGTSPSRKDTSGGGGKP